MIKLVFGLALLLFIGLKVYNSVSESEFNQLTLAPHTSWKIFLVVMLMPLNWLLESLKWYLLSRKIESTSFKSAIIGVIAGISTSLLTPNRIGNFIGRTMQMDRVNRTKGILATVHSNLAQFSASILFGMVSLVFLNFEFELLDSKSVNISALLILLFSLTLYYYPKLIDFNPVSKLYSNQMQIGLQHIQKESFKLKTTVLFLSVTRYVVFLIQFYLLLNCFLIDFDPGTLFLAIALVFLLTTIIPSFLFGKLFIREASALFVLETFGIESSIILITSFSLWFINLAIPSVIGAVVLIRNQPNV